ncbi:MAG: hypothetical protein JWO60_2040, partial [Frankiales bacterium]|nr:hypothetical protein [Frankiales bacterium]
MPTYPARVTPGRRAPALLLVGLLLALLLPPPAATAAAAGEGPLTGRVLRADGSAFPGAVVLLEERVSGLQVLFELLAVTLSAGTALLTCLADGAPLAVCRTARSVGVRTGPDGRWRAPFPGRSGEATLTVREVAGPVLISTRVLQEAPAVPDLRVWAARSSSSARGGELGFAWAGLPRATGRRAR